MYSSSVLPGRSGRRYRYQGVWAFCLCLAGCASAPEIYQPTKGYYAERQPTLEQVGPQIEQGRPLAVLDGLNHYVLSLPTKLLLWNWHVLDHRLPEEHERILDRYLDLNRLSSVKVRHNQYDPIGELQRLLRNDGVGIGYRSTFGLLFWMRYTLLPDRLLAGLPLLGVGDHFNPYTNTVHVYSSDAAVLLHEAGHAKDYIEHELRGTSFAMLRFLPGVDLLQEARASADAIRFLQCIRDDEREVAAYRTLIPAYSTYIAGYFPGGLQLTLPIVLAGHVSARLQARARQGQIQQQQAAVESGPAGFARQNFLPRWCKPLDPSDSSGD